MAVSGPLILYSIIFLYIYMCIYIYIYCFPRLAIAGLHHQPGSDSEAIAALFREKNDISLADLAALAALLENMVHSEADVCPAEGKGVQVQDNYSGMEANPSVRKWGTFNL